MKKTTTDRIFDHVLKAEGGFVHHKADAGGPTNFGITEKTLAAFNPGLDIRKIDLKIAKDIYHERYWGPMNLDLLAAAPALQLCLFDQGIHRGPTSAIKQLQEMICKFGELVTIDGNLGPVTANAVLRIGDKKALAFNYVLESQIFYARLCEKKTSQIVFLEGWIKRTHALFAALEALNSSVLVG